MDTSIQTNNRIDTIERMVTERLDKQMAMINQLEEDVNARLNGLDERIIRLEEERDATASQLSKELIAIREDIENRKKLSGFKSEPL